MPRKELHADCDGGIFCPVEGHVATFGIGNGHHKTRHVELTQGQRRTLFERRNAARSEPKGSTDER